MTVEKFLDDGFPFQQFYRVKQNVQAMEVCRRATKSVYDMNQNNGGLVPNFVPASSNNLTVTFNNQINALHSQVHIAISCHSAVLVFHRLTLIFAYSLIL
ncbi:hypothetical protein DPMN_006253 [Dreissena polymorpha]|uniref:Uncharacterized protein n=1 Tax=Dreissena polymorpha TaxID=45954 RepID=A0A9D4MRM3_DREPO|nr:hypothetical protein DPMN_006253 [Dreissena polymorpha]